MPSGLVTFLLTDIESSTRLFRRLRDAWPQVLDRHNELVRSAVDAHGGVEFKSEGDALLVAFSSAAAAFAAAVEAQAKLDAEVWPAEAVVRVRMGLHTGIAYPRLGDYIALALHQAARVVGAGNGGQVVASRDAVAAAGEVTGLRVERLGAFRLRDFDGPAELFAVMSRDAPPAQWAPLRALPADGHNLDRPGDAFIGRQEELTVLATLVHPGQVVTLCGPGGMGKTRLATEFGLREADRWPDGIWMADLAALAPGAPIAATVGVALGAGGDGSTDAEQLSAVTDRLRARQALVILDNCEHVLDGARELARRVVAECPSAGVLATSRERLGVPGEQTHVLTPLPVVDAAVELFVERAGRRDSTLAFGLQDRGAIAELCNRIDGLPLAIELAAARTNVQTPREILDDLDSRLATLGARGSPAARRQRTMRDLLDWSYDLLDTAERAVFRRVGVFVGSFELRAAAAAVGDDATDGGDVADIVWSLVDRSLIGIERRDGATRYRMLETARAVAAAYREEAGDAAATRLRLGAHFVDALPFALRGNRDWRARLAPEQATIVQLATDLVADGELAVGYALARLGVEHDFGVTGSGRDVGNTLFRIVDGAPEGPGLARLHLALAQVFAERRDLERSATHLATGRRLVERFGDVDRLGQIALAATESEYSLRLGTPEALEASRAALIAELERPLSDAMRAATLIELSLVEGALGLTTGRDRLAEAALLAERVDDHLLRMFVVSNLAELSLQAGDAVAAAAEQREAMVLSAELGSSLVTAFGLIVAARIAQQAGLDDTAVRLHAAADVLLDDCGYSLLPADRASSDEALAAARRALGDGYDAAQEAGRALALVEAVAIADNVFEGVATGRTSPDATIR
jgi:predicted ATPase/class 3 adenylate cyclase